MEYPHLSDPQSFADDYAARVSVDDLLGKYELTRTQYKEVRSELFQEGLRRGSPILLDPPEDLGEAAEELTRRQRQQLVEKKARSKVRREKEEAARRWLALDQSLREAAELYEGRAQTVTRLDPNPALEPAALVLPIHDLHYGKYASPAETHAPYDREIARSLAVEAVSTVLKRARLQANVEKVIMVCGTSDFLHVDTWHGTTTSGTPQDVDGTIGDVIAGGQALAVELVDLARQLAPVELIPCEGNHARIGDQWMHSYLQAWYRSADDVTATRSRRVRQYARYGSTTACFHHGEIKQSQQKQLGTVIAQEAGWSDYVVAYSGHKHFRQTGDQSGLILRQTMSLSGSNRWHERSGYVWSKRGVQADLIHPTGGPVATLTSYV